MYKPPEYFMEVKMGKTKGEKIIIYAARLMEFDDQLIKSATVASYNDAIRAIKISLDVALQSKEMAEFWPTVKKLKIELEKLEMGEIMKRQFSCQELYKELVRQAAEEMTK